MAKEYIEFVDDLPTQSLKTVLEFVRGNNPGARALALAALNVQSYALNQFLPGAVEPIFQSGMRSATPVAREVAEQALLSVIPDDTGTPKTMAGIAAWITILRIVVPIILNIIDKK